MDRGGEVGTGLVGQAGKGEWREKRNPGNSPRSSGWDFLHPLQGGMGSIPGPGTEMDPACCVAQPQSMNEK